MPFKIEIYLTTSMNPVRMEREGVVAVDSWNHPEEPCIGGIEIQYEDGETEKLEDWAVREVYDEEYLDEE